MTSNSKKSTGPHQLISGAMVANPAATALLHRWQTGDNVSQSFPSFDSFTYSQHAVIYLDNAVRLCVDDGMSDFRVFGALYLLRHGIELMLKCWSRNPQIDKILDVIMHSELSFVGVCGQLWPTKDERKKKVPILRHAVCALRNYLEDGLVAPEMHNVNIDEEHANGALIYLRKYPNTDRFKFTTLWPVASNGHDLPDLWKEAKPVMDEFSDAAREDAERSGMPPPIARSELAAIIALLSAMDDGGDGLRYPSSIFGAWYSPPPPLSLQAVGRTADGVKATCQAFESAREHSYSMSTFGSAGPKGPRMGKSTGHRSSLRGLMT